MGLDAFIPLTATGPVEALFCVFDKAPKSAARIKFPVEPDDLFADGRAASGLEQRGPATVSGR